MRQIILFALIFCSGWNVHANDLVDGYVVFAGKDTVNCKIKLKGKKQVTSYNTLVLVAENGEEKIYKTKEKGVEAYGFVLLGQRLDYRFIELPKNFESGFFRLIENGDKYKLYTYSYYSEINGVSSSSAVYVVFNPKGEYEHISSSALTDWKKKLRIILADNPEALNEIDGIKREQIPEFIKGLNTMD